jgi:hypothetical protein
MNECFLPEHSDLGHEDYTNHLVIGRLHSLGARGLIPELVKLTEIFLSLQSTQVNVGNTFLSFAN